MKLSPPITAACLAAVASLPCALAAQNVEWQGLQNHLHAGGAAPGPMPEVVAIPIGPQDPVFGPGDEPVEGPTHPPFEEIPWMPMPERIDMPQLDPFFAGRIVEHDAETGITIEHDVARPSGFAHAQGGGFDGFDGVVDPSLEFMEGFGTMSQATAFNSWPTRGNVKLVMRFTDQNNVVRWAGCSGAMQDAGVILTAGHCVYWRNASGINVFDWADRIYIYPGWDGVGPLGSDPTSTAVLQNWGYTRGTSYFSWTNWTQNGDFDWDAGAIRINRGTHRNVGMLTGWFGWAWGGGCSTNTSRTYHNFSYPGENCPLAGLHTSRDMYYWFGNFDSCPGSNGLRINTSPGCFTAVWGGMSGSNAYYIDGSSRFAHAVCSTSNRSTVATYIKFWESFIDHLNDNFRPAARTNTFDFEALRFRLGGSTSIPAGSTTSGSSFIAANATNASRSAQNYTVRVYLSTNNNITSTDTLLGTFNFNTAAAAMQSITVNLPGVTIPGGTTPGTYWLGVILDPATDTVPANNNTITWDAQQITVTPALSGACCFPNGSCSILTSAQCSSQGGNYAGNNVTCAAANCPQPTGACCFVGGNCSVLTSAQCSTQGGSYQGNNVTCAAANCPQPDFGKQLDLPPFDRTFSSATLTRGMWFQAPEDFIITGLRVPNETNHASQNVEVVRFAAPPPMWNTTTNNFVSLARHVGVNANQVVAVNIPIAKGDIIGILGACGDASMMHNSYAGVNTYETTILGRPTTLRRLGMQFNLFSNPAQDLWTESAAEVSRIDVFYVGPLGIKTLPTEPPNNGQTSIFLNITAERDLDITGLEYYAQASAGAPTKVEIWTSNASYVEFMEDPTAWTLHDTIESFSRGTTIATPIPFSRSLRLSAGETRGIYLIGVQGSLRYNGIGGSPPQGTYSDDDMTIYSEHARSAPWAGTEFTPRSFSGAVHYGITNTHDVLPDGYAGTAGNTGRNTVVRDLPRTLQFVVHASEMAGIDPGTPLTGLAWRQWTGGATAWPTTTVTWDNYDIELATSVNPPSSFSTTFENNIGSDRVVVRSGKLSFTRNAFPAGANPSRWGPVIPFTKPFIYNGGHLVVTIRHDGNGTSAAFMDSLDSGTSGWAQRFYYIDTTSYTGTTGAAGTFPITQITYEGPGPGEPCYADCNEDGRLNIDDFLCFINRFANMEPYADCDTNSIFNVDDFLCYINEFSQGCP